MPRDPLADVVRSLRLIGGVFLDGHFTAPWAIASKVSKEDCQPFLPIPKQVIAYHVVTKGEMLVTLNGEPPHVAKSGDVVFLPSNSWHTLASEPGIKPALGDDLVLPPSEGGLATIRFGGGGDETRILCGFIASETGPSALFDTLPKTLIIRIAEVATLRWLEASIAMAARELSAGRVSSSTVMSQLSELLLVEALRAYLESETHMSGWLAGMADPGIARALARIHSDTFGQQTIEALAAEAGMSRSSFVQRFTALLGTGPGRYALLQRIAEAKALLADTSLSTAQIAFRTGYDAPEAFSRAFKRETGLTPAEWRSANPRESLARD